MSVEWRHPIRAAVSVLASVLAFGCQGPEEASREWLFFPSPPAQPRVQFLTWASGAEQVEPKRGSFEDFILGEEPEAKRRITKRRGR